MTRDSLLTGRWSLGNIQRLAMRAVRGKNASRYFRWTAFYIPPDALVEPTFWFMLDALADGAVNRWAKDAENQLVHAARLRFADWALAIHRRRQGGKVTGKRADWMPELREDRRERTRPPEQLENNDIRRVVARETVRLMLLACKQEGFDVLDSYFNSEDGLGQRAAARELSSRLGRPVSVREYNDALTDVRLDLAEWLLGYRVPRQSLGRWPDSRNRAWIGAAQELGPFLDDIRQQRRIA